MQKYTKKKNEYVRYEIIEKIWDYFLNEIFFSTDGRSSISSIPLYEQAHVLI